MRLFVIASMVALCLPGLAGSVRAHVGPSLDVNNRYLRITPMRDRVRLAYTVYIGELPGELARARMDANRDGSISDEESQRYGVELAAQVARALDITWNDAPYALAWSEIYVGMGVPVTRAGSFSVDLIGWICGEDRGAHSLILVDGYRVPRPGETELRVHESPGITIARATVGQKEQHSQLEYRWEGGDTPLSAAGLHLAFEVELDTAPPAAPGPCGPPAQQAPTSAGARVVDQIAAVALVLLLMAGFAALVRWRARGQRAGRDSAGS